MLCKLLLYSKVSHTYISISPLEKEMATQVLAGESLGQKSLMGYIVHGVAEPDTTK